MIFLEIESPRVASISYWLSLYRCMTPHSSLFIVYHPLFTVRHPLLTISHPLPPHCYGYPASNWLY